MGNFYANLSVHTDDAGKLARLVEGRDDAGVVAPARNGWTVLSSRKIETQDDAVIDDYGAALSKAEGTVLAAMNHDDDMLILTLYRNGTRVAYANTSPGAFTDDDEPPHLEHAEAFAGLKDNVTPGEVEAVLTGDHLFAVDAHKALVHTLGLPELSAGFGYSYWRNGEFGGDGYIEFGTG